MKVTNLLDYSSSKKKTKIYILTKTNFKQIIVERRRKTNERNKIHSPLMRLIHYAVTLFIKNNTQKKDIKILRSYKGKGMQLSTWWIYNVCVDTAKLLTEQTSFSPCPQFTPVAIYCRTLNYMHPRHCSLAVSFVSARLCQSRDNYFRSFCIPLCNE